ncbi:MAG: LysM peptidoglycan-binding domain-containing protein [Pseudobutyrivibrio sp.]|nr:LysM peptidoglycan-binding domain-containing protein [Pseudobutyrivibrio sp.]
MDNPTAAKDIVEDANAVYGYAPSPTSTRLKDYVDYDWSDPNLVADMRQQRQEYHDSIQELYTMISEMKGAGKSTEDIARAVSTRRNEIRLESYKDDPEGLAKVKHSNLETYGNENGGTPEYFYNKYGSWETVIEKSLSSNPGADACLGLYDTYYDTYFIPVTTYVVVAGDNLSIIAFKVYGDKDKWTVLYELNKDTIKNPNLIYPNQVLKVQ